MSRPKRIAYRDLVLQLAIIAEGHAPTLAGILEIDRANVTRRLLRRGTRTRWLAYRATRRKQAVLDTRLRDWWRARLRAIGVDPATLPPSDPLWPACHRLPRGALVRCVAAAMRTERPGETLATTERLGELLDRCALLAARTPHAPDLAVLAVLAGTASVPPASPAPAPAPSPSPSPSPPPTKPRRRKVARG